MELKINKDELGDLESRSREFLKLEKLYNIDVGLCFIWFLLPLLVGAILKPLTQLEEGLLFLFGIGLVAASILYLSRKKGDYKVKDAEWARLYSYGIYNNLVDYFNTESPGIKKKARQSALTNTKSLLYVVQMRWNVGRFSLVENCRIAVSNFGYNLKNRVIPAFSSDDNDKLHRVSGIMFNLFHWSPSLTLQNLETLNQQMSTEGGPRFLKSTQSQENIYQRFVGLAKDKRIQPYLLPLALSGIVSVIVFLILIANFGSSLPVISIAVVLFVGLLAYLRPARRGQAE